MVEDNILELPNNGTITIKILSAPKKCKKEKEDVIDIICVKCIEYGREETYVSNSNILSKDERKTLILNSYIYKGIMAEFRKYGISADNALENMIGRIFTIESKLNGKAWVITLRNDLILLEDNEIRR